MFGCRVETLYSLRLELILLLEIVIIKCGRTFLSKDFWFGCGLGLVLILILTLDVSLSELKTRQTCI